MIKTKTYWKIHSILGLLAGIPMLIIALTGSILIFKDEINFFLIPEETISQPTETGRLPYDTLFNKVQDQLPDHVVGGWVIYDLPTQADYVYVIPKGTEDWHFIYLDQYSGEILSEAKAPEDEFMGWLVELHANLLAGDVGVAVVGTIAILLILLGFTGIKLYKGIWKSLFKMKWKTSMRLLSGNLHKRIGFISSPVFIILGITGGWWNIAHIIHEVTEEHVHHEVEQLYMDKSISLDELLVETQEKIEDFSLHYISFPIDEEFKMFGYYGNTKDNSSLRSPYGSVVTFDSESGNMTSDLNITDAAPLVQIEDSFRPLHYGNFGGIFTRLIWCVLGLAPGFLAVSGFYIWWHRNSKQKRGKRNKMDH